MKLLLFTNIKPSCVTNVKLSLDIANFTFSSRILLNTISNFHLLWIGNVQFLIHDFHVTNLKLSLFKHMKPSCVTNMKLSFVINMKLLSFHPGFSFPDILALGILSSTLWTSWIAEFSYWGQIFKISTI